MVESTIEPSEIQIDKVKGGRVRLLCRWDIEKTTRTDDMGTQTIWQYEETALWWTFPIEFSGVQLTTAETIGSYVSANKDEIMNFAKGSKVSL